jgi:hypothetical protein
MLMSDMSVSLGNEVAADFTLRDLNRRPAEVIAACDRLGAVKIRSRKGRTYELRAEPLAAADSAGEYPDFKLRRKQLGMPVIDGPQGALLDRLIAGD